MNIISRIKENPFIYISYFNVLYFLEIINIMFILLIFFGKAVSILAATLLTLLLSVHIIMLYFKKKVSRKIQLILMDIHIGYFAPFVFMFFVYFENNTYYDYMFLAVRLFMICAEIFFLVMLTETQYKMADSSM